ncbi:MAG: putative amidohydrolase YtcJ [Arenicella sp.]|jgi:predicted amidohydrolase YtcJ
MDSHVHIAELGEILQRINLADVGSPAAAMEKLKILSADLKSGE